LVTGSGIKELLDDVGSEQVAIRNYARHLLVALGSEAVPALTNLLANGNVYARAQAAKALGEIHDPAAASALVKALEDESVSVPLKAAEALSLLGKPGLRALLSALIKRPASYRLRHGAQRVFHARKYLDSSESLNRLLEVLDSAASEQALSNAAQHALNLLGDE
jgi:HEAT repeat protein